MRWPEAFILINWVTFCGPAISEPSNYNTSANNSQKEKIQREKEIN